MKKILAAILALLMIAGVFAGCAGGGSSDQSSVPAESSKAEESKEDGSQAEPSTDVTDIPYDAEYTGSTDPITFTLLQDAWSAWEKPMNADPLGQYLIAKTGVTIEPDMYTGDAAEKYALVLATKNYPDFMRWPGQSLGSQFIAEGALVAFDEYLDKLPNVVSRFGDDIGSIYDIDSQHMYRITQWSMGNSLCMQNGLIMRTDFMKEYFGEDSLTTPKWLSLSEIEKAFLDYKEKNPTNADGSTVYPFTSWAEGWGLVYDFGQFFGIMPYYATGEDTVGCAWTHEAMPELLTTLNRWYNNGILDPEFVINKAENGKAKLSTGVSIAVITNQASTTEANAVLEEQDPDLYFFAFPKVKADDHEAVYFCYSTVGTDGLCMTTACKDIDRGMAWIDFMNTPQVQFYCANGLPGEDGYWDYDENGMLVSDVEKTLSYTDFWERVNRVGGYKYSWMLNEGNDERFAAYDGNSCDIIEGNVGDHVRKEIVGSETFWSKDSDDKLRNQGLFDGDIYPAADSEEGIIFTTCEDIWKYAVPEIIMAKDEAAAIERYNQCVEELKEAGLEQYLAKVAEKYFVKCELMKIEP